MNGSRSIRISKLDATGNDFLVLDALDPTGVGCGPEAMSAAVARALCDRHHGVGADGLIRMLPGTFHEAVPGSAARSTDCEFELWNSDGTLAEMSGNGLRALAWVAAKSGLGKEQGKGERDLVVGTPAGVRVMTLKMSGDGQEVISANAEMGAVTFDPKLIPVRAESALEIETEIHGTRYVGDAAGMGNPHYVILVDAPGTTRVSQHGSRLENDERFPNRTNVEFISVTGPDEITMRVWERGVGETQSCGTGACAAAAVAHRRGLVGRMVLVRVPGGELSVNLGESLDDPIILGGPVNHVFDITVDLDALLAAREPE